MRFGDAQTTVFGTNRGSYSRVTEREVVDSQITLTDYEAELAEAFFSPIHVGNVRSNPEAARRTFRDYCEGSPVALNLVYPKPQNSELRLYLSASSGFKPRAGDIWFMYEVADEMWIGSLPEPEWMSLMTGHLLDPGDSAYAEMVDAGAIRRTLVSEREVYGRSRAVALDAFQAAGYRCEIDPSHQLFTSRSTGLPYLEPHHLIPISMQGHFATSLDVPINVFALCASCHRAIHYADREQVAQMLTRLYSRRPLGVHFSVDAPTLFSYYSIDGT